MICYKYHCFSAIDFDFVQCLLSGENKQIHNNLLFSKVEKYLILVEFLFQMLKMHLRIVYHFFLNDWKYGKTPKVNPYI